MILYRRWKSHHLVERAVRTVSARSRTLPWEPGMSRVTDTSMGARYEPGMSQYTDTSIGARYEQGHGHFNGSQV